MNLSFLLSVMDVLFLFFRIVVLADHVIVIVVFPESNCCFRTLDVLVCALFQVVVLQVAVGNNVVISKTSGRTCFDIFTFSFLKLFARFGSFVRRREMVVFHVDVADDVIVCICILSWPEIPRFFLRIVWSLFEASQLILEIQYVVCLFVS